MLSKAQSKHIRSLTQQKFRDEYKLFTAEGHKIVLEWLVSDKPISAIVSTALWAETNIKHINRHPEAALYIVKDSELSALSSLNTPNQVLIVLPYPVTKTIPIVNEWYLALDDIQDPGNMGTIIRIADWFGIKNVLCNKGCVNAYNPKAVQSAMGGQLRVTVYETDLATVLPTLGLPVFAATLHGKNIYEIGPHSAGVLVIGNESKGVSDKVVGLANTQVTIPRMGQAESLNAAVSTGILCALLLQR
jgi:RNA methyltransferase, TrmH family